MIHILAAVMIMAGHEFDLLASAPPIILGTDIHGLGVRILFLVSGYLVCSSYLRTKNPLKFLWKRISRLYPPLIVCLVVTILFMRMLTTKPDAYWQSAWLYFWHNLKMSPKFDLTGVFVDNPYPISVNGSLWTLPLELLCYVSLIPVLEILKALKKVSSKVTALLASVCLFILLAADTWRTLHPIENPCYFWSVDWPHFLPLSTWFFTGVLFYFLDLKQFCNLQAAVVLSLIYLCVPSACRYFIAPLLVGYLVLSFALSDSPLFCSFFKHDICYGLYLYAFPVQQTVIFLALKYNMGLNVYCLLLISILITFVLAEISYFVVEQKLSSLLKKRLTSHA